MGEMFARRRRIVAIAQRDPAGHEMEFRPVIFIGRQRGAAHDLISVLELTQIEAVGGQHPAARATIHPYPGAAWFRTGLPASDGLRRQTDRDASSNECGTARSPNPGGPRFELRRAIRAPWSRSP